MAPPPSQQAESTSLARSTESAADMPCANRLTIGVMVWSPRKPASRQLPGHATITTTTRHYSDVENEAAAQRYEENVLG